MKGAQTEVKKTEEEKQERQCDDAIMDKENNRWSGNRQSGSYYNR